MGQAPGLATLFKQNRINGTEETVNSVRLKTVQIECTYLTLKYKNNLLTKI